MDEKFQDFLKSQFSEVHDILNESISTSSLLNKKERYENKTLLAEGGQKKVFTSFDTLTGREIAYATAKDPDNKEALAKFAREARLSAHLEHPHIIPVYDTGLDDSGKPFFTMKLIQGQCFEEYLKEEKDSTHLECLPHFGSHTVLGTPPGIPCGTLGLCH